MDNDFCDYSLLDINLDTYGMPDIATVPITPGQADIVSSSYQPVMSCGGTSYESISFHQQQHLMGGVETSAEVGGITQPMFSEAQPCNTIMFDPETATDDLDSGCYGDSIVHPEQYHFKATVAKGGVSGRGKQFKFAEKNNMLYVKPKKSVPFSFSTAVSVPTGCWLRAMVIFASEVVAKQCGAVRRCPNHVSEDRQAGQLTNVDHFVQCRMEEAVYFTMAGHYCVSVPFDKLVDGVCLFSFACYNSCLEYKDDTCRKGKLVKPGLQVLFTLVAANETIIGKDLVDLRVCACPTRDAPVNYSYHSNNSRTRNQSLVAGIKHHRNRKRSNHHKKHQQQSLASLVKEVQSSEGLDKNDVVDEKAGLFKFTCFAPTKEQYQLLCTIRAAFQKQ